MNANIINKSIEMTKTEAKAAGKFNTPEYNELMELMKNFPNFRINVVKATTKKVDRFKGLSYDYMKKYIKRHDESKMATFYELCGLNENGNKVEMAAAATYGEVKMWFLTQFPEIEESGKNIDKILEETRKAREAMKMAA